MAAFCSIYQLERLRPAAFGAAESVHVSEEGTLWLPDKYGNVFTAEPNSRGEYNGLRKSAYVGPSRPLGHTMDADGNLLMADSAKVDPKIKAAVP